MVKPWKFVDIVDSILNIPRIGWIQRGVPNAIAESVGGHVLLTSYLTLALCNELRTNGIDIDLGKCLTMALLHDAHESVMGNVGNGIRTSIPNWYDIETQAFMNLGLPENLTEMFREYRYGRSIEGVIVQLADKMATLMRACRYSGYGYDVTELMISYRESVNKLLLSLPSNFREVLKGFIDEVLGGCDNRTNT